MSGVAQLWVYLQTTPLLGLAATLLAWEAATFLSERARGHVLANPMLICIALLVALLLLTGTPYRAYFEGGQYVQFLLGPATVALAVPMHANLSRIRRAAPAILPALLAGSLVASLSAMLIARGLGASRVVVLSLAPKSVTTPIAMGVAEQIGGSASLAAVFVLLIVVLFVIYGIMMALVEYDRSHDPLGTPVSVSRPDTYAPLQPSVGHPSEDWDDMLVMREQTQEILLRPRLARQMPIDQAVEKTVGLLNSDGVVKPAVKPAEYVPYGFGSTEGHYTGGGPNLPEKK